MFTHQQNLEKLLHSSCVIAWNVALSFGLMPAILTAGDEFGEVTLTENAVVQFATVEQGQAALAEEDPFLQSLSQLEMQLRLASEEVVTREQYVRFLTAEVLPWKKEQQEKVTAAAQALNQRLAGLQVPFPKSILLIHTSGKEETNAAYTRGQSIALPTRRLNLRQAALERLLAHELFHVLSRHDQELRRRLYATIGFQPCGKVTLPEQLKRREITNPDAPTYDYCVAIEHQGQAFDAIPLLLASREQYAELAGQPIFQAMRFRLWLGHLTEKGWQPALNDGDLLHIDGRKSQSYRKKIGNNTNYIIHPDEVLADNFVHLLMKTKNLPNPEIVEAIRRELTAP